MNIYKHSLANYPSRFKGFVVSPHKICLQWDGVVTKLRVGYRDTSDLLNLPNTDKALPLVTNGVGIEVLAVGCEMPVLEDLQDRLLDAYKEYWDKHSEFYQTKYGKGFSIFLFNTMKKLEGILCGR